MTALTWQQVNAWRLAQHCLAPRLSQADFLQAVVQTAGIQAQVLSAAELAIAARVEGLTREQIQMALWHERTLVKTWAMRGTLHVIAASDLPLYVAARSLSEMGNWANYFAYYGIRPDQYAAFLDAIPHVLGSEPLTRDQLAEALAGHVGIPELRDLVVSKGWGTPLKPLAWRGDLCFGPSQGQHVTFVRPRAWLGGWQSYEPYAALQEIARRYLRAFGPATPEDFARWWEGGAGIMATRKLFRSLADELVLVEVEGWQGYALRATLEPIQAQEAIGVVRLLPLFDAYVLGLGRGADIDPILPLAYQRRVFRPQGWISAVVLVDGRVLGIWEHITKRSQTIVKVELFAAPSAAVKQQIEAEVARLGLFLKTTVDLVYVLAT